MLSLETIVSTLADYAIPLWLAGMAVLAVRLIAGSLIFRHRSGFEPADSNSQSIANELAGRMGLRKLPDVRISNSVTQPMVIGLWNPFVVLPNRCTLETDFNLLTAILAHELAHIQRNDLWYLLIERIAGILWFFHPAMHRLNRQAALWREMAADRMATEVTGDPLALARALESAASQAGGMPRLSPFESIAITFASPRCRGRLGTRIEALLGPKGVCPVKISKKRLGTYLVLSVAFAFMATKLAAIGQEPPPLQSKSPEMPVSTQSDPFVKQVDSVTDQPPPGMIRIGGMDRIRSKMLRNTERPAPNPNQTFEVHFVSVTGKEFDSFLNDNFETVRIADDRNAWIADLAPVLDATNSVRRKLVHQAPKTSATDGEALHYRFTLPVTTVKYVPVNQNGKAVAVQPILQSTEYEIAMRMTGTLGPRSIRIEIIGNATMPQSIEKVALPLKIENPNSRPTQVAESVVTARSDSFQAMTDVPSGKSLVIDLGRTIEETHETPVTSLVRLANRKLWNREVYPYVETRRYLIVTPTELP